MAPSDAQKRAANKYNLKNMATLGCKVKREQAAAFKEYSEKRGKTSNTVLKEYVLECIESEDKAVQEATGRPMEDASPQDERDK